MDNVQQSKIARRDEQLAPLVIFSHGKVTGPKGNRITALSKIAQRMGYDVESLDYRRLNTNERVEKLNRYLESMSRPYVLVGTSMGGYVSAVAALTNNPLGVFLISPALYLDGYDEAEVGRLSCPTTVVHGWDDDIVPVNNVIRFAQSAAANLHIFAGGHRLREKLSETESCFEQFLRECFFSSQDGTDIVLDSTQISTQISNQAVNL